MLQRIRYEQFWICLKFQVFLKERKKWLFVCVEMKFVQKFCSQWRENKNELTRNENIWAVQLLMATNVRS